MLIFQHKTDPDKKFNTGTHWLYKDDIEEWVKKNPQIEFDKNVSRIYGGVIGDYYTYEIADDDPVVEKIISGTLFTLDIDPVTDKPIGIKISKKPILRMEIDKKEIQAGTETALITMKVLNEETGQIDQSVNDILAVPIHRLSEGGIVKISFVNGQSSITFKATTPGRYSFEQQNVGPQFILEKPITLDVL